MILPKTSVSFFLKGVAAIAEVTRQEDIGLDAIATLLRRDDDGNSYAEDTFVVQLKSESEDEIEYHDHEFQWFAQQTLPMFIGRVSLMRSEIALHPTIFANQAIWSLRASDIRIRFGNSDLPPMMRTSEIALDDCGRKADGVVGRTLGAVDGGRTNRSELVRRRVHDA